MAVAAPQLRFRDVRRRSSLGLRSQAFSFEAEAMSSGRRVIRLVVVVAAILAASALPALCMFAWLVLADPFGGGSHPSDAALLAQFGAKRKLLDELVRMIEADPKLQRLAPDFMRPEGFDLAGVSADRIAAYRRLCAEAGIAHGFSHYGDPIEFIVHTRGLAISGSAKGFVHAEHADEDATIVDADLDAAAASLKEKDALLERRIDGDWWLMLDMR
jgi:hypothetical protein